MKNLLTQRKIEEENQKTGGNMPLIDNEHNSNVLLIDSKNSGNVLLINRKLAKLEDDAECASFPKLTELVKKPSNLTRTGKKRFYCPISHSLACFIKPVEWLCFRFAESLVGLTDGLAMSGVELKGKEITIGFSGDFYRTWRSFSKSA